MKQVPFIANHRDGMHCVNAVFRMVHQHYFGEDISWEELDELTHAVPGKGTWTFMGEMEFAKRGLAIKNIEPVDYKQLSVEGIKYLEQVVGSETANYYYTKSNLESVIEYIPQYLEVVAHETRRATVDEIIGYLKQGNLVGAEINSRLLNHKPGFSLHFVLLYDFDGQNILLHDPGLPPIETRAVSPAQFEECFNFEGANGTVTIFGPPNTK